jgi:hypothetical protein
LASEDPLEKIQDIANEGDGDPWSNLIIAGGVFSPLFVLAGIVKGVFDNAQREARFKAAICALCDELQAMQERLPANVEDILRSEGSKRAIQALMEEASRAPNEARAALLGRVAAQGYFPSEENKHRQEDLASYIHDIAHLGTDDLQMLKLLKEVYGSAVKPPPKASESVLFRESFNRFRQRADELKIDEDDRVALCARLSGFGLAYEVPRVNTVQSPDELFFRPTRRGMYLLSLLEAADLPVEKQN